MVRMCGSPSEYFAPPLIQRRIVSTSAWLSGGPPHGIIPLGQSPVHGLPSGHFSERLMREKSRPVREALSVIARASWYERLIRRSPGAGFSASERSKPVGNTFEAGG